MRTRSSSNLLVVSPSNLSTSNPKRRNRKRSKQPFILEESPIDTMANQRTMAELLRAPTEGYAEVIVVPSILAEQFKLKYSLINIMTSDQTTNLRNEISNFQQRFDESFHEAWDRYKDLLCACPHHGFTELHQLDTFYNALNPADQDSLNAAAGGNLLERRTQDVLTIIKNKSKIAKLTHAVNQQTSAVTTAMTAILKQFQATPPPASVKSVKEICVTCGAAVNYNQGNAVYHPPALSNQIRPPSFAQPNVQNNQNWFSQPQGYNRGNNFNPEHSYQAPTQQNQIVPLNELEKFKRMNEANMKAMQTQINNVKNELRNEMKNSIQASLSNQTDEIKNMMASLFQMNTASTSGSGSLPSNTVANPKGKLKAITTRRSCS
nr:reverse transcriptase domain-containing protein [Tanacetum cinerariifolium]